MIGRSLDKLMAVFSPRVGLDRSIARARFESLARYDAARRDRFSRDVAMSSASADSTILADRMSLLSQARAVARDTSTGKSIRRSFVRNVVGAAGITPTFAAVDAHGDLMTDWNTQAARLFRSWSQNPRMVDIEKRRSWTVMLQMAVGEMVEAGESFIVRTLRPRDHGVGLVLQAFEPEQIDLSIDSYESREVRHGVEIDEFGAAVAYHFLRRHDDFRYTSGERTIRVPASRVCHLFDPERVRQTHGVPRLHAVLKRIGAVGRYEEATLMAALMEACIGMIEKPDESNTDTLIPGLQNPEGEDGLDGDGNQEIQFQPGMVARGNLEAFVPTRPGSNFEAFMMHNARAIGAGAGTSYEQVARDFSQGTYSSQRQGMLEDQAEFDCVEQLVMTQLCVPVIRDFITIAVAQGLLNAGADWMTDRERYFSVDWQGPPRPWIDPKKEADAAETEIALGINTRTQILNQKGRNVRDVFQELREERELAEEYGLDISGKKSVSSQPAGETEDADEDDDNKDTKAVAGVIRGGGLAHV